MENDNKPSTKEELRKELKEKSVGYVTAAFGLVVGLAWNEAIKSLIEKIYPVGTGGLIVKFIYAAGVTIIMVIITWYLIKISKD